ncbi:MAG: double-strand break repair protein AddB [Geminicoccaceae bacterium]
MAAVRTVPAHLPFLDCLVAQLLGWERERLADALILLPSRRACLAARESFLRLARGAPLLLPQLVPIGEPDEAELLTEPAIERSLPPAIGPLRRRLLLMRLLLARTPDMTHEQAVRLAGELEGFLDETHHEEVDLAALDGLAPGELAEHWQETVRFLTLVRDHWPAVLAEEGRIEPALRRRRLLDALAGKWRREPPDRPVIAAGITGTVPCVARLLALVARLPQGMVVVPALDQTLDETSWQVVGPSHPQYGLRRLLELMEVERAAVRPWDAAMERGGPAARLALWGQVLRPADTTESWRDQPAPAAAATRGLELAEAPDLASEALQIALRLRAAVEVPGKRAVLVTPNRFLSRRVAAELLRWGIKVDDSAGIPLDQSPPGTFLLLVAHTVIGGAAPVPLLACLKHPLARGGLGQRDFRRYVRALERATLRGPRPTGGLEGLVQRVRREADGGTWHVPVPAEALLAWLEGLAAAALPMAQLAAREQAPFQALLEAHLAFAEWLARDEDGNASELWAKEAGTCAHQFVSELRLSGETAGEVPTSAYPALLAVLMGTHAVRPRPAALARIGILGQLESRLVQADLVILGGLNEGASPPAVESGPWMNRAMRRRLGLPPVEQAIGFAAHDFLTNACAPEVVLSRAAKDENGAPTTPSRWLARLAAVLAAAQARDAIRADPCWAGWAEALDRPQAPPRPEPRPEPRPPLAARPRELWATDIERLMRDPYAVYARRILLLDPLDPLDADPGGAERGQIVHAALEEFVRAWPEHLPADPLAELVAIGRRHFARQAHRPQVTAIWWPRFLKIARWFCEAELRRRAHTARIVAEVRGRLEIACPGGPFRVRARADRIEVGSGGELAVVDYKTGPLPGNAEVRRGIAPQLLIEALIAEHGGFDGLPAGAAAHEILFWQLIGGEPLAGKAQDPVGKEGSLAALLDHARTGLTALLAHFDDPRTAYVPIPRPEIAPAFNDYAHLARIQEWWGTEAEA